MQSRMLTAVSLLALVMVSPSLGQGPSLSSCTWRVVPLYLYGQTIEFAEVSCDWDMDLYVDDGGTSTAVTAITGGVTTGTPPNEDRVSRLQYLLQGSYQLCCGTTCAVGSPFTYMGPATTTAFLNFFGDLQSVKIQSVAAPRTLTYFFPFAGSSTGGSLPFPIARDAALQCATAGTLVFTYGPTDVAACTAANSGSVCSVQSMGGAAAARNQQITLGAESKGACLPAAVDASVVALQNVLDSALPALTSWNQIGGIEAVMSAFATEKALVACRQYAESLFTRSNVTRAVGSSRDCVYDYETQRAQYDSDPCCAHFSTKCCAPRSIQRTFQEIGSVLFDLVTTGCSDVSGALGNLKLIAQDINARAALTSFGFEQLGEDFNTLTQPASDCLSDAFFGFGQSCTKNGDCWSDDCDMSNAQYNSGKGNCQPSNKPYRDFLKCIFSPSGVRPDVQRQLAADMGITATTRAERVRLGTAWLESNRAIDDCVGERAWQYQASVEYNTNANGDLVATVIPANATGCLKDQKCNYGHGLSEGQCLGNATLGTSSHFCARCYGTYCYEETSWSECIIGGWPRLNEAECVAAGGQMTLRSPQNSFSSPTCQDRAATNLTTCVDYNVCPGPNSQSRWVRNHPEYACSHSFCYNAAAMNRTACNQLSGSGFWWNSDYANGQGLCISWGTSKTACETGGNTYWAGREWRQGRLDTNASCMAPKCQLPNEYFLREWSRSRCESTTVCDQTCEKCVSGWSWGSNTVPQEYCFIPTTAGGQCSGEARTSCPGGSGCTTLCYLTGLNMTECAAENGTYASCGSNSRPNCNQNTAEKDVMQCRWNRGATCTPAECADPTRGECTDWDLPDYSCDNQIGCGRCVKPFPAISGNPNIVNDSYAACQAMTGFTRYLRIGCGADSRSALNKNASACVAAGGMFKSPATNEAECLTETACIRWGSSRLPMSAAACTECANAGERAVFGTMYDWNTPSQVPGVVIQLDWKGRAYGPINQIKSTVPYSSLFWDVYSAITKVLGRVYAGSLRQQYSGQLQAWARLACSCLPSGSGASETAVCTRLANEPVATVTETCNCDATGACDAVCPWSCPSACQYNVTRYWAAGYLNQNALRRRLQTGAAAGWAEYETVKNSNNEIIGQTVGNADRYNGVSNGQVVNLCLTVDSFIQQSPAYTIYDFAPGTGTTPPGAPGVPLMMNLVANGDVICANVTAEAYPYWPVKRLPPGGTRSPTAPTTPRPGAPTQQGGSGRVAVQLTAIVVAVLGFFHV